MGMLDGKEALITGGSRGQGRAHAVTCAREGTNVVIVDIAEQISTVVSAENRATWAYALQDAEILMLCHQLAVAVYGGTQQIQRKIVAERLLGLPRG